MALLGRKITAFAKKVADLPDRPSPSYSAPEIKAQFDSSPEELRVAVNGIVDELTSITPGSSGSEQIGSAPIAGVTGSTVYSQLTSLKGLTDGNANQNAFSNVAVPGQSSVIAHNPTDILTLTGGTGISITTNAATDTVTITATGTAVPGAHASNHITGGLDVIPNAVAGGSAGLMSGADKLALDNALPKTGGMMTGNLDLNANNITSVGQLGMFYGTKLFETTGQRSGVNAHANRLDVLTQDGANTILKADYGGNSLQFKGQNVLYDGGPGGTVNGALSVTGAITYQGTALPQSRLNGANFEYWNGTAWTPSGGSGVGIVASTNVKKSWMPSLTTVTAANVYGLLGKWIPPGPGEFIVSCDLAVSSGTAQTLNLYIAGPGTGTAINTTGFDWRTAEGTMGIAPGSGWLSPIVIGTTASNTLTTYTMVISIPFALPIYFIGKAGSANAYYQNLKVSYDVVTGGA